MSSASTWRRIGAWDGIASPGCLGISGEPGVTITPRHDLALAYVIGSGKDEAAIADLFWHQYGIELPLKPRAASGRNLTLVWSGPCQWLAVSAQAGLTSRLGEALKGHAAVTDQSDGRAVLDLWGLRVRDLLAKGCPVDLHPRAFVRADVAVTAIAGMGVQLWHWENSDSFSIAVARSTAASFWSWLTHSAAEFGVDVRPPKVG
jgi:sarcosine oxidase subunit gamma